MCNSVFQRFILEFLNNTGPENVVVLSFLKCITVLAQNSSLAVCVRMFETMLF